MEATRRRRAVPLLALLTTLAAFPGAPRAAPEMQSERWVGLRVVDPELRRLAVMDVAGPLVTVADGIPYLVLALSDETQPVRAAARERLRALAAECVDPLLDALEAARPGPRGGPFGTIAALGAAITTTDLAAAAGGMSPADPPDRREAALLLALPNGLPRHMRGADEIADRMRIAEILLGDQDEYVRRTAAGALGLLGLVALREAPPGDTPLGPRGTALTLQRGQRERLVELMHGSPAVAGAAAGLAGRFGDDGEAVVKALGELLEKETTRDQAGLALAALGDAARAVRPALERYRSFGTWCALVRAGMGEKVDAALAGKDRSDRRLAADVLMAEGRTSEAVAAVVLAGFEDAREDAKYVKLEYRLRDIALLGSDGRAALPQLEALVMKESIHADIRDLAAAVALGIDPSLPWARLRVTARVASPPSPKNAEHGEMAVRLVTATALAAALDHDLVSPDQGLTPPLGEELSVMTLLGRPVGVHVTAYVVRHPAPAGPYATLLWKTVDAPAISRAHAWAPPTLRTFVELGWMASAALAVRREALAALAGAKPLPPEGRTILAAMASAPDPWLRHLAARTLRRSATK